MGTAGPPLPLPLLDGPLIHWRPTPPSSIGLDASESGAAAFRTGSGGADADADGEGEGEGEGEADGAAEGAAV